MSPELRQFLQITGGAVLSAVILDIKAWATAPKDDAGDYPKWDWSAAVRSWTVGLITGISATGIVSASS